MAPGGTITGSTLPFLPGQPAPSFTPQRSDSPEPDVIREWRERRELQIQHRDEVSAERKAKTVQDAQQNIDDFYENYNNKKEKEILRLRNEQNQNPQQRGELPGPVGVGFDRRKKVGNHREGVVGSEAVLRIRLRPEVVEQEDLARLGP